MDEDHDYVFKNSNSFARSLIVLKWSVLAFLLTNSYRSVLLAMMTNISYENTIDTIDDLLESGRTLWVAKDTGVDGYSLPSLLATDPRMKIKELSKQTVYFNFGTGQWEDLKDMAQG